MFRVGHQPGTDGHGKSLRCIELELLDNEPGSQPIDRRLQLDHRRRGCQEQEFVGAVAAHHDRGGKLPAQLGRDREERLIAGTMAVVVVEKPEVVDVDQSHAEGRAGLAGSFDLGRQMRDQRAMVQRICQWVAPTGLDQRRGLAGQPALGCPEDQEQQDRDDDARAERDDDHVTTNVGESPEDRHRVAPDSEDSSDVPVAADGQELAQDRRRPEIRGSGCGLGDRKKLGARRTGNRAGHALGRGRRSGQAGSARRHDRPVEPAELDEEDVGRSGEGCELRLERGPFDCGWPDRGIEIAKLDPVIKDRANSRGVACDDRVQRARREVQRDHDGLGRRGDPDDREEDSEHEHEQQRAADSRRRAGQLSLPVKDSPRGRAYGAMDQSPMAA